MTRALVVGCAGPSLGAEERAFLRDARPWGLILFKRNVVDRAQLRALVDDFRAIAGRADAPVLIDQEGGRVQRMGPPHWLAYPAAARFAATRAPERAAWLAARLIAADLFEVGINIDCAPVLDVAGEGMHAAIGARAFSDSPNGWRRSVAPTPTASWLAASRPSSNTCRVTGGRRSTAISTCRS